MSQPAVVSIESLRRATPAPAPPAEWKLPALAGCLTELSGTGAAACLTLGFALVLDAQRRGEPVAWLTSTTSSFFPPDAAAGGVDLDALVVVRLSEMLHLPRAAELLARSGAFGLLVLDLGAGAEIPIPMQVRLVGLAQKHGAAVLCLTRKGRELPSLGSLISLRGEAIRESIDVRETVRPIGGGVAVREPTGSGEVTKGEEVAEGTWSPRYACTVQVLKDKRRGPGWKHTELFCGPAGLR